MDVRERRTDDAGRPRGGAKQRMNKRAAQPGHGPRAARSYWETRSCGSRHSTALPGTRAFFEEADEFRYSVEPVDSFAEFGVWLDKRVLEVGSGMGGDLSRFLRAGARAIGIDLSPAAVGATLDRLKLDRLPRSLARADALRLPFKDRSFDLVWSWGVLHHTGDIERAISEVHRVLDSGGEARLMLYHRPSWVALAAWGRWALLRAKPFQGLRRVVADHVESPGTLALTSAEVHRLLRNFQEVRIEIVGSYWDRKFVPMIGRLGGSRLGWFALIRARKA